MCTRSSSKLTHVQVRSKRLFKAKLKVINVHLSVDPTIKSITLTYLAHFCGVQDNNLYRINLQVVCRVIDAPCSVQLNIRSKR